MDLTDEQWLIIQPLMPLPSQSGRGRPPLDRRLVLNGVLWKLRTAVPWYHLPPGYPSWQTCYACFRLWSRQGLMDQIYLLLYQDLRDRGGLDLFHLIQGDDLLSHLVSSRRLSLPQELESTWQGATLQLLLQVVIMRLKVECRPFLIPSKSYKAPTLPSPNMN